MATFEARVEAITGLDIDGSSVPSQDDVTEFLKDAVNEYTNIHINARPADAEYFIRESALSDTQAALSADSGKIISDYRIEFDEDTTEPTKSENTILPDVENDARKPF